MSLRSPGAAPQALVRGLGPLLLLSPGLFGGPIARAETSTTSTVPARIAEPEAAVLSRCEGPVTLLLVGLSWDGWPELCADLRGYLALGGPPFSEEAARGAEDLLKETSFFRDQRCVVAEGGRRLVCALSPVWLVTGVDLETSLPFTLLREDLERRVSLRQGHPLTAPEADLDRQRQRLLQYLSQEGFFFASGELHLSPTSGVEPAIGADVEGTIDSGPSVSLGAIRIDGDHVLTETEIREVLTHYWVFWWFPARFRPEVAASDTDRLTELLKSRGYPEAVVELNAKPDFERGTAEIVVTIRSGPRLSLAFSGHRAIPSDELATLSTFAEAGAIDLVEVDETALAIKRRYQEEGFYQAAVEGHADTSTSGTVHVTFTIQEGPKAFLSRVDLFGAKALPEGDLRDLLATRTRGLFTRGSFVDAKVAQDVGRILDRYAQAGYAATEVRGQALPLPDGSLAARFDIDEGPRRWVHRVTFDGLPAELDARALLLRLSLRDGEAYRESELGADRRTILAGLAAAGFPRATIGRKLKVPQADLGGGAEIHYTIERGPKARFAGVFVRGNIRTDRSVIVEQLELDPDQALDLSALAEGRQRLRELGIFASVEVRPIGLGREREATWLLVTVEEQDRRTLDGVVAFSTSDLFSVGLDYRDRNLFGRATSLDLSFRFANASELLTEAKIGRRDELEAKIRTPRPFGVPADLESRGYYQAETQPTYKERRVGGSLTLIRRLLARSACRFCPTVMASFGYELAESELELDLSSQVDPTAAPRDPVATIGRIVPRLSFDRRDSFVDPRSGYFVDLRVELANRYLAGPFFAQARNFWRAMASAQGYLDLGAPLAHHFEDGGTLAGALVLAGLVRYGVAHPYGRVAEEVQPIPLAETFAYGGDLSVRGLAQGASRAGFPGANYLFVASAEVRFYLLEGFAAGSLQVAGFVDFGAAGYHLGKLFLAPTVGVGPAIRYVTPIGPLSVAYGWPVVRSPAIVAADPLVIPSTGTLHLSFGSTF